MPSSTVPETHTQLRLVRQAVVQYGNYVLCLTRRCQQLQTRLLMEQLGYYVIISEVQAGPETAAYTWRKFLGLHMGQSFEGGAQCLPPRHIPIRSLTQAHMKALFLCW